MDCCPICLERFLDKSLTGDCLHAFCFECIRQWARVSMNCPLCKQPIRHVLHRISRDGRFYQRYDFRQSASDAAASTLHHTARHNSSHQMRRRSRHRTPPEQLLPEDERVWNAFNRRKLVYHHRVFAKHVGANPRSNYRPVTPDAFRQSPARLQRLRPWLRRDLRAVLGEEEDVELLVLFIEGALVRYSMQEQRTVDVLLPYLGDRTEQFIHELVSFARSPFELDTYDRLVQYDWPAEALQDLERFPLLERRITSRSPTPYTAINDEDDINDDNDYDYESIID